MFQEELMDVAVCNASEFSVGTNAIFAGQTPLDNRECFGVSGLVYLCRANTSDCEPFLGNGDKNDEDGYLYKRNRKFSELT